MAAFVVKGGSSLRGEVTIGGAKNVALKAILASLLTDDELVLHNIPDIRDVTYLLEMLQKMGMSIRRNGHSVRIRDGRLKELAVPFDVGARLRTSSMVIGPMLARWAQAKIPNPGGCRIGARPIDRHIAGLRKMGASISYSSRDGYYYAQTDGLHGAVITFPKNTHTGTETLILAAVLAKGRTVLKNAASEVEIDDLMALLNSMGAQVKRVAPREIVIDGAAKLHGADYTIMPDRNEEVTFAIAAFVTRGDLTIHNSQPHNLTAFFESLAAAGAHIEVKDKSTTRYIGDGTLRSTDVVTEPHPGFMTDWQSPWTLLMTQAKGASTLHETVFESRLSYVGELQKMGAKIEFFDPKVLNPRKFYNFNWRRADKDTHQAIRIIGPTKLHNAVVVMNDLRAGATLLLATLVASGTSYLHGVEQIDRGYEKIEERLNSLGAHIERVEENHV